MSASKTRGLTAFVRQVVLPAGPDAVPRLKRGAMKFRLSYRKSKIHRWGIFAEEDIPARRRVIEYTGERIDNDEVRRRSVRPHIYHFWVTKKFAIDGAIGGSGAEFINHSCDPNLVSRSRGGRIWLNSLRPIKKGEELLYAYNLTGGIPQICKCGSPNCRGLMNYFARDI